MRKLLFLFGIASAFVFFQSHAQTITTYAGDSTIGYGGDGSAATGASLAKPSFTAMDRSGNIYVTDFDNNRIRKIDLSGTITTIAGTGHPGFSGDGGAATMAELYNPNGITFDDSGNIYFTDFANHRVRKIDSSGIITTVAGNAVHGPSGYGVAATAASLYYPSGVAVDKHGNIFISDEWNNRILKVDTLGIIRTIAGNGPSGYLLGGYSGDGSVATAARINFPADVIVDTSGNVYFTDCGNHRVRKIDTSGIITSVAGNGILGFSGDSGPATAAQFHYPNGLTLDRAGNLYIGDEGNYCVRKIDIHGIITTIAGVDTLGYSGDGGVATAAKMSNTSGVAVYGGGDIYVCDKGNSRIRVIKNELSTLSNSEVKLFSEFKVYPNPNSGSFTVNLLSGVKEECRFVVTNLLGEKVCGHTGTTNEPTTLTLNVPEGVYFIAAQTGQGVWSERVLVR